MWTCICGKMFDQDGFYEHIKQCPEDQEKQADDKERKKWLNKQGQYRPWYKKILHIP